MATFCGKWSRTAFWRTSWSRPTARTHGASSADTAGPAPAANPLRTVDSFGRAVRRSTAQLKALDLSADVDRTTARKKLDTCLANLEELRRTVEALKAGLDG